MTSDQFKAGAPAAERDGTGISSLLAQITFLSTEQILAHPRWPQARDCYIQVLVQSHSPDPAISRVMQDVAGLVLFNLVIAIYEARGEARKDWPTINRIRESFANFGLASDRSTDEMLARMRQIGLIELQVAPADKRVRLVRPTQRMVAEDCAWHDNHTRALAVLRPDSRDYDAMFAHEPLHRQVHRAISNDLHEKAFDVLDTKVNPLVGFVMRQDGAKIIFLYLQRALAGGDPSRVSLSYAAASERIDTSRTHIRNLLAALESSGLLRRYGNGGNDIELTPELWRHADYFIASMMSANDRWWQLTRAQVAEIQRSTQ
ncbi:MAG: hypothetical protein P0Y65_21230 [Candidatus Devosia phytovorans]|uniref:Uncharacterized protein n=1 Tax=Candidatus Devosia phytovorans TaxID=3121372 RepID=A0AAJ5VTU1_9HYPH|nr:hypothetical protein [Devosia sp.]WEK04664.1 MAG: hypothetical protein P0Y65_21230 [Devosia sp.]